MASPPDSKTSLSFSRPVSGCRAAIGSNEFVVRSDIGRHLFDFRDAFPGHRAILALDVLATDKLFAVAKATMGRTGRNRVEQPHLVFVQQTLYRREVHLVARIFRAFQVERFIWAGLHQSLQLRAGLR